MKGRKNMNKYDEKILINTGLAVLYRLLLDNPGFIDSPILHDHPRKDLLTLDNIKTLSLKYKVDERGGARY